MSFLFIERQFGCGRVQIIVPVKEKTIKSLTVKSLSVLTIESFSNSAYGSN